MIKYSFLFISSVIFWISGCASTTSFDKAKVIVKENLPYPQFTAFRNLKAFPGDVICGEFESPDKGLRYVTSWRRFIVVKGEMGPSNTLEATDIFCSENSGLSLYKTLGIDLRGSKHEKIMKIQNDLSILLPVIYEYQRLNAMLPPSGGGLSILLSDGTVNGLLDAIPKDPWGKPYNYESVQWGGSASQRFKLWTYGKDNKEGGVGEDADISHQHLPYLRHVGSLPKNK